MISEKDFAEVSDVFETLVLGQVGATCVLQSIIAFNFFFLQNVTYKYNILTTLDPSSAGFSEGAGLRDLKDEFALETSGRSPRFYNIVKG